MTESPPGPRLTVRTGLGTYRTQWDELVTATTPPSPMLRSWWLEAAAGPRMVILLVVDGQRLVGGLALDVRRRLGLVPVFSTVWHEAECTLYPDVLVRPGDEDLVADLLRRWFDSHRNGLVEVAACLPGSRLAALLPPHVVEEAYSEVPYVEVPDGFEDYLSQRSRNWRSTYRRQQRRLEDEGYRHRRLDVDETELGLSELRRLHAELLGDESVFLPHYERFARIARAGVRAGELGFEVIELHGRIVAINAMIDVAAHRLFFQTGRDTDPAHAGAGTVLLVEAIRAACERDAAEVDLHRGLFAYKLRLTDRRRPVVRLHGGWGPLGRLLAAMEGLPARIERAAFRPRRWLGWKADGAARRLHAASARLRSGMRRRERGG